MALNKGEHEGKPEIIYISGAITGATDYMERFAEAEERLTAAGYKVINPAKVTSGVDGVLCYEDVMELDIVLLGKADAIYMLQGWEDSRGANREYGFALAAGKKIWKEEDESGSRYFHDNEEV